MTLTVRASTDCAQPNLCSLSFCKVFFTKLPHHYHTTLLPYYTITIPKHYHTTPHIDQPVIRLHRTAVYRSHCSHNVNCSLFWKSGVAVRCFHKSGVSTEQCEKANSEHWNSRISLLTIVWPRINPLWDMISTVTKELFMVKFKWC